MRAGRSSAYLWFFLCGAAAAAEMVKWSESGKYYAIGMDRKVQCYLAEVRTHSAPSCLSSPLPPRH